MWDLYRRLIALRHLYTLPVVSIASRQWELPETLLRVALRHCLGLPSYATNIPALVEAKDSPLHLQAEGRAMRHLERYSSCSIWDPAA